MATPSPIQPTFQGYLSSSARSPRSRRNRPCDFCRYRKVACKISAVGVPCELCLAKQHACTFDEAPRKRRRPRISVSPGPVDNMDTAGDEFPAADGIVDEPTQGIAPEMNLDHDLHEISVLDFSPSAVLQGMHSPSEQRLIDPIGYTLQDGLHRSPTSIQAANSVPTPASATSQSRSCQGKNAVVSPSSPEPASGRPPSPLMRFVGSSGDLDTYLLAHRHYDEQNFSVSRHTQIVYQRLQNLESSLAECKPPPLLTMCRDPSLPRGHEITDIKLVQDARQEVHQLLNLDTARRLSALFARFVHPYLPIIEKRTLTTDTSRLFDSPALLAAIAATASHFVAYDDVLCLKSSSPPSPGRLYQLSWRLVQEDLASPRLSTVQVLILLLHRHLPDELSFEGSMDSNIRGLLVASTYSLGLNRDPSNWDTLSPDQRKLRRCLWWVAWVTEKWMAFSDGMPSQYHRADYNVAPLEEADIAALNDNSTLPSPFVYLNQLTFILDDVVQSYFSLAASDHTSSSLSVSLELAKNLRLRLKAWFDGLPNRLQPHDRRATTDLDDVDDPEVGGNFSLNLAYMTTQLAIYRALIRPVSLVALQCHTWHNAPVSVEIDLDAAEAVVEGAISNSKSLISSLTKLTTAEWDSFWPGCKTFCTYLDAWIWR
ncbi:Zn(II)2Cys6 transcription factor [Aspergillus mulundensis]|uniref:Putative Zn(II)2Cys6 transcription factor n=1 Tax=Aspergillus mulundensis TaxID=1810919 RepID=A0A3D8T3X6_9EURO|nr:putative Zn(II)2Cys6 transcription factor [Aspergillus mulundensis]RDW92698.1 putative Zn(II)2Cys6 transcription factor [Aspergillus mulundensis]